MKYELAADYVAPVVDETASDANANKKQRTLWGDAFRRLRRNKLALVASIWIIIVVIIAITADLWVPQTLGSPTDIDSSTSAQHSLLPPRIPVLENFGIFDGTADKKDLTTGQMIHYNKYVENGVEDEYHPFGTDLLGRDVLSRIIYGSRVSLAVGLLATSISVLIGLIMGAIAAYYGGIWDVIIMRLADIFLAFPYVLFVIAILAVFGPGFQNVFIAIGILGWPSIARVFRSAILSVKENDFIDAARAMGAGDWRIIIRHIFPNSVATIIVYATMSIGGAILTESALSFLGMGVQPPTPSWGLMISDGKTYLSTAAWLMMCPGVAILSTVLAFTVLGDGLRDALDVKMKDA